MIVTLCRFVALLLALPKVQKGRAWGSRRRTAWDRQRQKKTGAVDSWIVDGSMMMMMMMMIAGWSVKQY